MKELTEQIEGPDGQFAVEKRIPYPKKRMCNSQDVVGLNLEVQTMGLRELMEYLVTAIVDDPESVRVSEVRGGMSSLIEVKVADLDIGMVIGREGNTVRALRTVLGCAAARLKRRAILNIIK